MRIAITQPNFFPWIGYFDLLMKVEKIIFLDDVLLSPRSFLVRNRLRKSNDEAVWITESVSGKSQNKRINEQHIVKNMNWLESIRNRMGNFYKETEFIADALSIIDSAFEIKDTSVSGFNASLILLMSDYLEIYYDYGFASQLSMGDFDSRGAQENIIGLCRMVNASQFYNFKNGIESGLYSPDEFSNNNIRLFKQDYKHPKYRQRHDSFMPYLSILDLIANEGKRSKEIIRKGSDWICMN